MIWLHPGTMLLILLLLYFLAVRRWKVALALIGFIFITDRAAWLLERGFGPARPAPGVAVSILLLVGCAWFLVVAVAGRLAGGGERSGSGDGPARPE